MAKEGSVAPKERINIVYKPETGDAQEEVELPFRFLVVGDFNGRESEQPIEEREVINIDKDNFDAVLEAQNVGVGFSVANKLSDSGETDELPVDIRFKKLRDFSPDGICEQVPELRKMIELREALSTLKGPLSNIPGFRKRLQAILDDPEQQHRLIDELGLGEE